MNHYSAHQFLTKVTSYLHKEIKEHAIVGPVTDLDRPAFPCSPLLTRPRDGNKCQVIIDLSYPKGNAVNDFVDRALSVCKSISPIASPVTLCLLGMSLD